MAVRKTKLLKPERKNNTTTVRLYNLAKTKQAQRMKSNDPGARKGSTKSPMKRLEEIGREAKKRAKMDKPAEYKFITRKGKRVLVKK